MPAAKLFGEPSRLSQNVGHCKYEDLFWNGKRNGGIFTTIPFKDNIFLYEIFLILDVFFSLKLLNIPLFLYHLVYL